MDNLIVFVGLGAVVLGIIIGWIIRVIAAGRQLNSAESNVKRIIDDAQKEYESKKKEGILEAKEEMHKSRMNFDRETKSRRTELQEFEKRVMQKETNLDRKVDMLEKKELELDKKVKYISSKEKWVTEESGRLSQVKEEQKKVLERLAKMTPEEAKKILLSRMEEEVKREGMTLIRKIEQQAIETADRKAKRILSQAIQKSASEYTADITVSTVSLPDDEMKGRIIGREGRNIKAFETASGVDLIIDDTPGAITLSAFDGVRREIARVSLERLIADGRIQPARIEETVKKAGEEMDEHLKEVGEQAAYDLNVQGLNSELFKLIGRLRYRTSYGQNVLQHSIEVAKAVKVMAAELKLDVNLAVRAGLLHDIGKAIDHDVEGTHAKIGADLTKKYEESDKVVNAIAAHHEDCPAETIEAVLIQAGDAISASRPGARRESLEFYLKRLENLEKIAESFPGVEKSYAIQAGREIRIIVDPANVDDDMSAQMAREVAKRVEQELKYPGQIKVTVVREVRSVEVAK